MRTITTHYINGMFVKSHGRQVQDSINPNNRTVIARVTLGDQEDARLAIAAAKEAFVSFSKTTKEERCRYLRKLYEVVNERIDDLTKAMVEEYGGVNQFSSLIVRMSADAFLAAEKALQEMPLARTWGNVTVTMEPVGVAGLITAWNSNSLFICLKLAAAIAAGCTTVIKIAGASPCRMLAQGRSAAGRVQCRHRSRHGCGCRVCPQSGCCQNIVHRLRRRWADDYAGWRRDHETSHP
jgi:aldehyde dehydrogenase (NAD+)